MIRAIITDFDGTLVDTFEANLRAYQEAFHSVGLELTSDSYRECFGFRYDRFMSAMGINDVSVAACVRELKKEAYPKYFSLLRLNHCLMELISTFHQMGVKTAIASTARKENLMNVVSYLGIAHNFDLIFAGVDVSKGKPDPEIYVRAMDALGVVPEDTLIFEDSPVGIQAAEASGAKYIPVTPKWFHN